MATKSRERCEKLIWYTSALQCIGDEISRLILHDDSGLMGMLNDMSSLGILPRHQIDSFVEIIEKSVNDDDLVNVRFTNIDV